MSLFKVRDFWSLNLEELHSSNSDPIHVDGSHSTQKESAKNSENFIASLGRFAPVGDHDLFVCGSLSGSIFLIQVPEPKQQVCDSAIPSAGAAPQAATLSNKQHKRPLIAAKDLKLPIVDIKCGFFNSAVRQSIAVLSFEQLVVLQVRARQANEHFMEDENNNVLCYEFEEFCRLELLLGEIGASLLVLASFHENLSGGTHRKDSSSLAKVSNQQSLQELRLPQRDKIIVQYSNQFCFTLIENKKIIGHFEFDETSGGGRGEKSGEPSKGKAGVGSNAEDLSQYFGPMPMAHLLCNRTSSSLVVSLSDYQIFNLPINKLEAKAKQDVMKRVAANLLQGANKSHETGSEKASNLAYGNSEQKALRQTTRICLELETISDWKFELISLPIQMEGFRRRVRDESWPSGANPQEADCSFVGQVLVLSRYNLDLFSESGAHLWSSRFEKPQICLHSYTIQTQKAATTESKEFLDRLLTLICSNSTNEQRAHLTILQDNKPIWSAMLNCKPSKLWRSDLGKTASGLLVLFDSQQDQLNASYLGTNLDSDEDVLENSSSSLKDDEQVLRQLEQIDAPLFEKLDSQEEPKLSRITRLVLDVQLKASGTWPDVIVEANFSLRPSAGSMRVIQNIVAEIEFDDLIQLEQTSHKSSATTSVSKGVLQVQLGNCWPDRQEPILFEGKFSLLASKATGTKAFEAVDWNSERNKLERQLMPKSLKVYVRFKFNENTTELLVQEESFLLPLSMVTKLLHADYSSGQNQELSDVLENLSYSTATLGPTNYFCDIFLEADTSIDLLAIVDDLIELDLLCRGTECNRNRNLGAMQQKQNLEQRQAITVENLNLLSQSLDCRLRYKSPTGLTRQTSEDTAAPIFVSLALSLEALANISSLSEEMSREEQDNSATVWIHLIDLRHRTGSIPSIADEFIALHSKDWKRYSNFSAGSDSHANCSLLVAIECEQQVPVIFFMNHMLDRLNNSGQAKSSKIRISERLHDSLNKLVEQYSRDVLARHEKLSSQFNRMYSKFKVAVAATASLSKKLINLPDEMCAQFNNLTLLTRQYQNEMMLILTELEHLRELEFKFNKIPTSSAIKIERKSSSNLFEFRRIFD